MFYFKTFFYFYLNKKIFFESFELRSPYQGQNDNSKVPDLKGDHLKNKYMMLKKQYNNMSTITLEICSVLVGLPNIPI